jgi:type 1 fimbria pilin
MAKFINFNIVGGYNLATAGADPSLDGDNLVNVDNVLNVKAETGAGGEFNVVLQLTGGLSCRVTCGTSAGSATSPADVGNRPTATDYLALMKKAVNRAITANPGGVKASALLPLDSDDPNIKYDETLRVYWKDILVS